jgi:hypothetical protein
MRPDNFFESYISRRTVGVDCRMTIGRRDFRDSLVKNLRASWR